MQVNSINKQPNSQSFGRLIIHDKELLIKCGREYLCKETGQYRKGELGLKPLNSKVLYNNLGLQKSPVCPISINFESRKSQVFHIDIP